MSRRRLTQNLPRKASAPPATPGYEEPSIHPAAYPDPEADAYENGDTSSWAEDPHPGPYPNGAPPALPGTDGPQGHPATDLAHYFPNGASKQASRQLRAALEAKAAKCIRLASRMLGKHASTEAIEDQAIDLMSLTERQIQASLRRYAEQGDGGSDLLAVENMTLTPPRTGGDDDTEALLQAMLAEEGDVEANEVDADEALLASMLAEETAKRLASVKKGSKKAGQNDPRAFYSGKKAEEDEKDAEDESDAEEADEKAAEDEKPEGDTEAAKKAAHFQRLAAFWMKKAAEEAADEPEENEAEAKKDEKAKKAAKSAKAAVAKKSAKKAEESDESEEKAAEESDDKAEKKAAFLRLANEFLSADLKDTLAALIAEDAEAPAAEKAADDLLVDDLSDDPMVDGLGMDDEGNIDVDDLSVLYGMHTASEEEGEKAEEEEPAKEEKQAAVRPQARKASTGIKTLGTVAKVASSSVDDLSKLWASAPDVSDIFGTSKA